MTHQPELKPLAQRLLEQIDRAVLPGRLFLGEREMREVIQALTDNSASEEALALALFGEGHAVGKQWRDIIAKAIEYQTHIVELVAVCDTLSRTVVCQYCGARCANTDEDRLGHITACEKRPADNPLAQEILRLRGRVAELESIVELVAPNHESIQQE